MCVCVHRGPEGPLLRQLQSCTSDDPHPLYQPLPGPLHHLHHLHQRHHHVPGTLQPTTRKTERARERDKGRLLKVIFHQRVFTLLGTCISHLYVEIAGIGLWLGLYVCGLVYRNKVPTRIVNYEELVGVRITIRVRIKLRVKIMVRGNMILNGSELLVLTRIVKQTCVYEWVFLFVGVCL